MSSARQARILRFPIDTTKAVDELNLCEFPLTVLSNRSPKDQLELNFADYMWDESAQEHISRTLNVSAPPMYGLPTAKDEEVLLALIHYTDQVNRFSDATVHFSRYELIKLLGWDQGGKSYRRIHESLARWKSVTLNYQNAWRDHSRKSWVSEVFSLIDNVTIYERDERRGNTGEQIDLKLSSFTWNRVFFDSMQAKYFKRLDFAFYQQLESATARRLYRILDKRFGAGRTDFEFELSKLAFQRINLNRNYDTGKIKEKLAPAIQELEEKGFLKPLPKDERYWKQGKTWKVRFAKAAVSAPKTESDESQLDLLQALSSRGVSPKIAAELSETVDREQITSQLECFDWLIEHYPERLKNPGGFLAESVRANFQPPAGFQTKAQIAAATAKREARESQQRAQRRAAREQQAAAERERQAINEFRQSLSQQELDTLKRQAESQASDQAKETLQSPRFRQLYLDMLVDNLIRDEHLNMDHSENPQASPTAVEAVVTA